MTAALLGVGYGLNYSVINGLAANEAPPGLTAQALLLFSLSYFIGVFGFPFITGTLISSTGVKGMLLSIGLIALFAWALSQSLAGRAILEISLSFGMKKSPLVCDSFPVWGV